MCECSVGLDREIIWNEWDWVDMQDKEMRWHTRMREDMVIVMNDQEWEVKMPLLRLEVWWENCKTFGDSFGGMIVTKRYVKFCKTCRFGDSFGGINC